jgi:LAO/AO transport system kinase
VNYSISTKRSLAKLLTSLENRDSSAIEYLSSLPKPEIPSRRIGITGPPGTGKSTLVNEMCKYLLAENQKIGILAVDPSSPFTNGAILGDRVRMTELSRNDHVFVRSIASRGHLGGLSAQAGYMADALEFSGYSWILIETVGIGQSELEVADHCDCVVVVLNPESGDGIQAMKAGLMEIANVFVVNKSDHSNTENFINQMEMILHIQSKMDEWNPPVVKAVATKSVGISEIVEQINLFNEEQKKSGKLESEKQRKRLSVLKSQINDFVINDFWTDNRIEKLKSESQKSTFPNLLEMITKLTGKKSES